MIRVSSLGPLLRILRTLNAPTDRYLERVCLPRGVLAHPEAFIPLRQVSRLIREAAAGEGRPDLGLLAGQEADLAELGMYGQLAASSATLGDALGSAMSLMPAFSSAERWRVETLDGDLLLHHRFVDGLWDRDQSAEHYTMSLVVNLVRRAAGCTWRPREVHWQTGYAGAVVGHEMFRGTQIKFARPEARITIPIDLLALPFAGAPSVRPITDDDAWRQTAPPDDILGALRQIIAVLSPHTGHTRIELVAAALGVSVRTLQRRLRPTGHSFEDLTKEMRLEQAVDLLAHTESRILDIALDLGYSDHAHFTRAFRRWMGVSPIEYRRRQRMQMAAA